MEDNKHTLILPNASDESKSKEENETDGISLFQLISAEELNVTVQTLQTLNRNPSLLKSKALKGLKSAIFDFQRLNSASSGTGNTLVSRISCALSDGRWTDALVLLSEMRIRGESPKLGALQRWVRDCDAASGRDGTFGDPQVLRVLDSILRTTTPEIIKSQVSAEAPNGVLDLSTHPVIRHQPWKLNRDGRVMNLLQDIQKGLLYKESEKNGLSSKFKIVQNVPGPMRKPPNLHPAILYASESNTIPLSKDLSPSKRHDIPHVPGAFLLEDVLSKDECREIVKRAEAIGFTPDQAAGGSAVELESILAHNFYWLADDEFLSRVYGRVKDLLPQEIQGGKVRGINARFRVYRYVPGAVYRPHIDGAWPPSGLAKDGTYLYDSSTEEDPIWSRLTFLLYLNEEFNDGCTTFFLPASIQGFMDARPVKPSQGCALVFPHGDTKGSLLHEGSPVGEGGAKYVIRTDVLYEVKKGEVFEIPTEYEKSL
eukprot:TRINITY_DN7423_c0_g1_i1.p1 TRINITY_DN7423_c0_g1~~TRINITY_DN7423_c0_g1_i1.p1  ORF type:complete len:522 (+),score=178.22 TRINITY_DN7423_c0_g1_i1:116-1567(+)